MAYAIEKDWTTKAGMRAVVICMIGSLSYRCGYVAVPPDHPAFGKSHVDQLPEISQQQASESIIGNKSPLLIFTAGVGADNDNSVRRSIDVIIDVHGGVTYSGGSIDYPVDTEKGTAWWFGYDCGHYGDDRNNGGQPLEYCVEECEKMATQLVAIKPLALSAPEAL